MVSLLSRWRRGGGPVAPPSAHTCRLPRASFSGQLHCCHACWTCYRARLVPDDFGSSLDWSVVLATPERTRTLSGSSVLEVETDARGLIVAVWYEGERLPYVQVIVSDGRAELIRDRPANLPALAGVRLIDP